MALGGEIRSGPVGIPDVTLFCMLLSRRSVENLPRGSLDEKECCGGEKSETFH